MCESRPENLSARRQKVLSGILLVLIGLPAAAGVGVALPAQTPGPSAGGAIRYNGRERTHTEELVNGRQRAIIVELK